MSNVPSSSSSPSDPQIPDQGVKSGAVGVADFLNGPAARPRSADVFAAAPAAPAAPAERPPLAPSPPPAARDGADAAPAPEPQTEQPASNTNSAGKKGGMTSGRKLLLGLAALALLAVGGVFGSRYLAYSRSHVTTDDAYVTGNLVNVSPLISGTLIQLVVDEGAHVKKGQLIARLDDTGQRAAVRQAQAAYQAALSQVPQARLNLVYQRDATEAAVRRAQAALAAQRARTQGAQAQASLSSQTVSGQVGQGRAQVTAAQAQAAQVAAQVRTAEAALTNARQGVQTAERSANAVSARIQAAEADVTRTSRDEARYRRLLAEDAVTRQQYDAVASQYASAQSALTAAQEQAAQARSQVDQAQTGVVQAGAQLAAARRASEAASEQIQVARAGLSLARTGSGQAPIQTSNVASNAQQTAQAQADLQNAVAGRSQIALRERQIQTALAQAAQARAALQNAQVLLGDTRIYAPSDGTVVRKTANVGASLSPGQTILTLTQGDYVYVTANYKETQLEKVRPGQPVEIEVDAHPDKTFLGRVQSINEATGATTSLLPPDNATGNFTKVVQRVPVRIQFVPAGAGADKKYARRGDIINLRQGMSVTAIINVGGEKNNASEHASGLVAPGRAPIRGAAPAASTGGGGATGAGGG